MSKKTHPDLNNGVDYAFQKVAGAYKILSKEDERARYDVGDDLESNTNDDGSKGETFKDKVEKDLFPERHQFQPFGDPYVTLSATRLPLTVLPQH